MPTGSTRLEELIAEHADLERRLADPAVHSDAGQARSLGRRYAELIERELRAAIAAGEVPEQDAAFTAAALVGACGEALVGPLSPVAGSARPVAGSAPVCGEP